MNHVYVINSLHRPLNFAGCPAVPQSPVELFKSRDVGGGGGGNTEPVGVLLAAQHRRAGGRQKGERTSNPGGAAQNGGGPGGLRGRHGAQKSCHRPEEQGADREIRHARSGAEVALWEPPTRSRNFRRHHCCRSRHAKRSDQEASRVLEVLINSFIHTFIHSSLIVSI